MPCAPTPVTPRTVLIMHPRALALIAAHQPVREPSRRVADVSTALNTVWLRAVHSYITHINNITFGFINVMHVQMLPDVPLPQEIRVHLDDGDNGGDLRSLAEQLAALDGNRTLIKARVRPRMNPSTLPHAAIYSTCIPESITVHTQMSTPHTRSLLPRPSNFRWIAPLPRPQP